MRKPHPDPPLAPSLPLPCQRGATSMQQPHTSCCQRAASCTLANENKQKAICKSTISRKISYNDRHFAKGVLLFEICQLLEFD